MSKREDAFNLIEREMVFLAAFDMIQKRNDRTKALEFLKEWSSQSNGHNKYAAGIYYVNNFILPTINGADCSKRYLPRWVDEELFHPVLEPETIPEFLRLFQANYVDCFRVKENKDKLGLGQKIYDPCDIVSNEEWAKIVEDNKKEARETFFCPLRIDGLMMGKTGRRLDENVEHFTVCFSDFDGANKVQQELMISMFLEPSIIVESSNGFHVYYFLDEEIEKEEWVRIQKGMIKAFGSDQLIKNPSRLLRVPFTWHMKDRDNPFFVTIKSFRWKRYTKDEMMQAFPYEEPKKKEWIPRSTDKPKELHIPLPTFIAEGSRHAALLDEAGRTYAHLPQEHAQSARDLLKMWYSKSSQPLKPNWEKEANDIIDYVEKHEYGSPVSQ